METQFGRDFGSVRIHESVEARSTARSLDAAAATIGSDVLVGVDQFDPTMPAGWALLAHELAHVAQFDRLDGDEATLEYSAATSPIEREANRAALGTFVSDVGPIQAVPTVAVALADDDWWNTAGGIGIDMLGPAFAAESMYSGHLQTGKLFPGWMGPLTGAFGMGTGMWDMLRPDATTGERVRGGLGAFAGTTDMLRWGGMAPPLHTTVGGAFKGGGIAKALASGGAVVGAGLAGYGAGRLLDQGTGFALRQAHMAIDSARGVDRPEERYGDYSISGMYGTLLSNVDQAQVAGRRTLGTLDESEPAYKQTLGWRIAEVEQGIRGLFD